MNAKVEKLKKNIPELRFSGFDGEWEEKRLGEVVDLKHGYAFKGGSYVDDGKYRVVTIGNVQNGRLAMGQTNSIDTLPNDLRKHQVLAHGDLLVSMTGNVGRVCIVYQDECLLNQRVGKIVVERSKAVEQFVFQKLNSRKFEYRMRNLAQGGAQGNISNDDIRGFVMLLPLMEEQQKIAGFLTTIDEWIENLKAQKGKWEEYKKGMMQKIFSQEIRFRDEDGNDFPDWEEKRLGEVGRIVTGKTPSTTDKTLWGGDVLFVTPTDIANDEKYQRQTVRKVKVSDLKKILPRGSILYTCIASIGKMSLSMAQSISNQQINALITDEKSDNEFVYYALLNETPRIKAIQANTTLPIINKTEFSRIKIGMPVLDEQQKIAGFLTTVDEMIHSHQQRIAQAEEWKKGLMQRMFV